MLGDAQVVLITPPPSSGWPRGDPIRLGLYAGVWRQNHSINPPEPIERFKRRASLAPAGLGQQVIPGQLLLLQAREQRRQTVPPRVREMAWRRAHEQELGNLVGQWVIVEGDELIAHGPDPGALVAAARVRGIRVPYVFFVEPFGEDTAKLGF
ncbi:MAG: DUF5678 domain-containing protein [Burkholderiales bacterium]